MMQSTKAPSLEAVDHHYLLLSLVAIETFGVWIAVQSLSAEKAGPTCL